MIIICSRQRHKLTVKKTDNGNIVFSSKIKTKIRKPTDTFKIAVGHKKPIAMVRGTERAGIEPENSIL